MLSVLGFRTEKLYIRNDSDNVLLADGKKRIEVYDSELTAEAESLSNQTFLNFYPDPSSGGGNNNFEVYDSESIAEAESLSNQNNLCFYPDSDDSGGLQTQVDTLDTNLNQEITDRANADADLQSQIDALSNILFPKFYRLSWVG
jgi:hypothetical protein